MHTEDQLRATIELDRTSGEFVLDEGGYTRFIPSEVSDHGSTERKRIESWLAEEIERAREDHKPIFAEAAENIETYKAVKTFIKGSGQAILPSPIARNPADQKIASTVNKIVRARPMVSFDPYFPGKFPVAVPTEMPAIDPMTGQPQLGLDGQPVMQTVPLTIEKSAEDIAFGFEQGMEFKNRERLRFIPWLHRTVHDCVTGAVPTWTKVYREKKRRPLISPKVKGAFLDLTDKEESYVKAGEDVVYCNVPYSNVLRPNLDDEIDDLEWISELTPKTPSEITAGFKSKEYFLIADDAEAQKIAESVTETTPPEKAQTDASTKNYSPQQRRQMCDVMEVWFYRNLKVIDPDTGEKVVKRFSLMGEFHVGAKRLLSCFRNPYDHQKRIHVPFTEYLDGSSTVGMLRWHQTVYTHCSQSEIKNSFHANNFSYRASPGSDVAEKYANQPLATGVVIVAEKDEFDAFRPGAEHASLLPLMMHIRGDAVEASKVSAYESGQSIPGRTPSSTVQQILERGGEPGNLFLLRLNEGVQKVMRLYLETARQYSPMGETVPVIDPETKAILEVPFRFPLGECMDNIRISLTAADEALSKEHAPEEIAMLMQLYQQRSQFVASLAGPLMDPRSTPAAMGLFQKIIEGDQVIFEKLIGSVRTDTKDKFDVRPAIDALIAEKQAILQQQQMQQESELANANQAAEAGGVVSGAEGRTDSGGYPGAGGEPGLPPDAVEDPEAGVQPEGAFV